MLAYILSFGAMLALCGVTGLSAQASSSDQGRITPQTTRPANWSALPASWHGYAPRAATPDAYCTGASVMYNRHSGKVLEVYGWGTGNGANVDQWSYDGGANQHWCFFGVGDVVGSVPAYEVVNNHSGKCLDLTNGNTSSGANIQQWTCNGGLNQDWALFDSNNSYLFAPDTIANGNQGWAYVMEVYNWGTANADNVDLWASDGGANQEWCSSPCS